MLSSAIYCFVVSQALISFILTESLCIALNSSITSFEMLHARAILKNETQTFLYFAYGSNMLTKRIHINNPTAVQKYIGSIKNHRLDFNKYSNRWKGAASTIVPDPDHEVWGVVWEININDLPNLDKQEGVDSHVYFPKNVTVNVTLGKELECRVYQQCELPDKYVEPNLLPPERQPSLVYLSTMIGGAREFEIPGNYIEFLESFKNNGYNGSTEVFDPSS